MHHVVHTPCSILNTYTSHTFLLLYFSFGYYFSKFPFHIVHTPFSMLNMHPCCVACYLTFVAICNVCIYVCMVEVGYHLVLDGPHVLRCVLSNIRCCMQSMYVHRPNACGTTPRGSSPRSHHAHAHTQTHSRVDHPTPYIHAYIQPYMGAHICMHADTITYTHIHCI